MKILSSVISRWKKSLWLSEQKLFFYYHLLGKQIEKLLSTTLLKNVGNKQINESQLIILLKIDCA